MNKGLVSLAAFFLVLTPVKANGFATINVEGQNEATVGETINVSINLQDIKETINGVVAIGGDLKFDDEYLEYVGSKDVNNNYKTDINEKIFRIAGVDYTLKNGIKDDSSIYTFTFKVLKEGNTTVTFEDAEVVDVNASEVKSNVKPLNITINSKAIEEVKTPELENLNENTVVENIKEEIVKTNNKVEVKEEVKNDNKETFVEEIKVVEETKEVEETETQEVTEKNFVEKVAEAFLGFFNILLSIFR